MIGPLLFGYALLGVMAAALWPVFTDEHPIGPEGAEPAIRFLVALLWPLALVAFLAVALFLLVASIAGGFAALWRHWRAVRVPKATARKRGA